MFTRHEICYAILFVVMGSVSAINCPNNETCQCESNELVKIFCEINNSSIDILIEPDLFMKVHCSNLEWSDLHMYNFTKYVTKEIYFKTCNLPKNNSLKTITDMLGATKIEKLFFNSFKHLDFQKLHLKGFKNLRFLDLSYNYIFTIDKYLLEDLSNLSTLVLHNNNLQTITFDYPLSLHKINLGNNNLTELQSGNFDKLINLTTLFLQSNNLVSLPEDIFEGLTNLRVLYLAENNFTLLPRYLLQNNTNLKQFYLFSNKKKLDTLPNGFFRNLTQLRIVSLKKNGFIFLPEDLFWECLSLTVLVLSGNNLSFLPKLIFRDLKNLISLKLDSNAFDEIPNIFQDLKQLIHLDLSKNRIFSIPDNIFQTLIELEELNMADNFLTVISDKSVFYLHNLRIADFSNNSLTLHSTTNIRINNNGMQSPFVSCFLLEQLYLSHNHISYIFKDWIFDHSFLQKLDLKNNYISSLSTYDLQFASNNIEVDLTYNKIQYINLENVEDLVDNNWSNYVMILIGHNPLHCDCELYDYLRYIKGKIHSNVIKYIDIDPENLTCHTPSQFKDVRVINLQSEFCAVTNTDIAMCPKKCNCFKKQKEKTFVIDCFRKNITIMPNLTIKLPHSWQFELNLSNNQLTQMPNLTKLRYGPVNTLILSNNNISEISLDGLSKTLKVLELHNNNISTISSDVLNFLTNATNLTLLTLRGNPWICDCNINNINRTVNFRNFIFMKFKIIADRYNVTCYDNNKLISNIMETDLCSDYVKHNEGRSYGRNHITFWFIFIFVGLIIGTSGLFCYIYRLQLKRILFTHKFLIEEAEEDEEE